MIIFNPETVSEIVDPLNLKNGFTKDNYLQPAYIFEFGTEKSAKSDTSFFKHLENDIEKLNKATMQGYLIHIHRNKFSKKGKIQNENKLLKYLDKIKKIINEKKPNPNVKIIIFIVNIGNENIKIFSEGKIKVFIDNNFVAIARDKIESILLELLK